MSKKPVSNLKYKDVKKVLDTGKTINDVELLSDQIVAKRKNEYFKRIKPSTIIKLIEENNNKESIYNLAGEGGSQEDIYALLSKNLNDNISVRSVVNLNTGNDNISVVSGKTGKTDRTENTVKSALTTVTMATEMLGDLSKISFIILDLREKCDYDNYHIKEAISYPGQQISRDKWLSEMITLVIR